MISGEQITVAMRHCPDAFLEAILESSAVLACRVTPLQKAELVDFVKHQTGATSLSVGDGANDVPMYAPPLSVCFFSHRSPHRLHAGNIGVGIFGREGTQAVSAADFAVRRFRDLRPLLFVHGRNALLRNSALIQFQVRATPSQCNTFIPWSTNCSHLSPYRSTRMWPSSCRKCGSRCGVASRPPPYTSPGS